MGEILSGNWRSIISDDVSVVQSVGRVGSNNYTRQKK